MQDFRHLLEKTIAGSSYTDNELSSVFEGMLNGQLNPHQVAAFLAAWRVHGESSQLLTVGARLLRKHAKPVAISDQHRPLCDNCGTGGSGIPKFNISTAAAIVAAACGVRVAKHGNRSVSSRCGSADLLFEAGFPVDLPEPKTLDLLRKTNLTFFYAPNFHPMMANVAPVRNAMGIKTIFNLLGPLANPLNPDIQLIGLGHRSHLRSVTDALAALGTRKALVVHSMDGLDEISPAAPTSGLLIERGNISEFSIDPSAYGITGELSELTGQDASYNLKILHKIFAGEPCAAAEGVIINAAALLWLAEHVDSLKEGVQVARETITNKKAKEFFASWIEAANAA